MDCSQKVVLLMSKYIIVERYTGSYKFGYPTFYNILCKFRIFELFTDSHPLPGPHKPGKIDIQGMVGESGQFNRRGRTVCPLCKCNPKYFRSLDCIRTECLIKITHPEKQNGVRMLCLDVIILLHQRCLNIFLFVGHGDRRRETFQRLIFNKDNKIWKGAGGKGEITSVR